MGIAVGLDVVDGLVPQQLARGGELGDDNAMFERRPDDRGGQEPFAAQFGIGRKFAEDVEVARRVDTRAD